MWDTSDNIFVPVIIILSSYHQNNINVGGVAMLSSSWVHCVYAQCPVMNLSLRIDFGTNITLPRIKQKLKVFEWTFWGSFWRLILDPDGADAVAAEKNLDSLMHFFHSLLRTVNHQEAFSVKNH